MTKTPRKLSTQPPMGRGRSQNPFRDPQTKPGWAQLTRLAGDRAAILFEDLRRRLSVIDGLREELFYHGPEQGWGPRYRVGEQTLLTAHILPGALQVRLELEPLLRESVLSSARVAVGIKEMIRQAPLVQGNVALNIELSTASLVQSWARIVVMKSKFDKTHQLN